MLPMPGVLVDDPAEIYAPFDAREVKCLREYVDAVEDFAEQRVLKETWKWTVEIRDRDTQTYGEELDYVGEPAPVRHGEPLPAPLQTRRAHELRRHLQAALPPT